jgi:hypothetical protein
MNRRGRLCGLCLLRHRERAMRKTYNQHCSSDCSQPKLAHAVPPFFNPLSIRGNQFPSLMLVCPCAFFKNATTLLRTTKAPA